MLPSLGWSFKDSPHSMSMQDGQELQHEMTSRNEPMMSYHMTSGGSDSEAACSMPKKKVNYAKPHISICRKQNGNNAR